jgi:hypothetical protein
MKAIPMKKNLPLLILCLISRIIYTDEQQQEFYIERPKDKHWHISYSAKIIPAILVGDYIIPIHPDFCQAWGGKFPKDDFIRCSSNFTAEVATEITENQDLSKEKYIALLTRYYAHDSMVAKAIDYNNGI